MTNHLSDHPAFLFASQWHKGQHRKGLHREDFILHPLRVAETLLRHQIDDDILISAALLHDVLEDTPCPWDLIRETFGEAVLGVVLEVTDDKHLLKSERKQHQVERAELLSPKAGLIRLADKIDNVQSLLVDPPSSWGWPRQRAYVAWARRVVNRISSPPPDLLQEFNDVQANAWAHVTGADLPAQELG